MNNTLNNLKNGVIMGIGFFLIFGIVNAWTNLINVTSGDTLTATIWNDMVTKVNETGNRVSGIFTDGTGKVGIGTTTPTSKLDVAGVIKTKGLDTTIYRVGGVNSTSASLSNSDTFTNFPNLSISFTLTEPTTVLTNYKISMDGSLNYLVTRTLVDGVVVSRSLTGNTAYWDEEDTRFGELGLGNHTVTIQYRTPILGVNNPSANDRHNRELQVVVFGS